MNRSLIAYILFCKLYEHYFINSVISYSPDVSVRLLARFPNLAKIPSAPQKLLKSPYPSYPVLPVFLVNPGSDNHTLKC